MSDTGFDPNRPPGVDRSDPVPDQDILDESVEGGPSADQITPGAGEIGRGPKDPGAGGAAGPQGSFGDTLPSGDGENLIQDEERIESSARG